MRLSTSVARAALVAVATLAPSIAFAQFANPGFEVPPPPNGGYQVYPGGSNAGGWTVVGTQVLWISTTYTEGNGVGNATLSFKAHSGQSAADLTGAGNNGTSAGVQQSVATTAGQAYAISFWVGKATGNQYYPTPSTVDISIDGGARTSFTNANYNPNVVDWQQFFYTFIANGSSTLVTFYNGTTDNNMVGLDDVSINAASTTTPEPAGLALLATGLVGVIGVARRKMMRLAS